MRSGIDELIAAVRSHGDPHADQGLRLIREWTKLQPAPESMPL